MWNVCVCGYVVGKVCRVYVCMVCCVCVVCMCGLHVYMVCCVWYVCVCGVDGVMCRIASVNDA